MLVNASGSLPPPPPASLTESLVCAAGCKSKEHAQGAAGALGWRLSPDQVSALDAASESLQVAVGLPFENW